MKDYKKIKKIQKYSKFLGCLSRLKTRKNEIIFLVIHIIFLLFILMNLLIVPWKILKSALLGLRITILVFTSLSLICLIYDIICRKTKKLHIGITYLIGLYCSITSLGLMIFNFISIFISMIIIFTKVKKYKEKRYDYNSILAIDLISIIIFIIIVFLWLSEILNIYAKIDFNESLKDYIDEKIKQYLNQNEKIVNVEIGEKRLSYDMSNSNPIDKNKIISDDVISSNKMELCSEKSNKDDITDN
jgi:hypothetical protein